jgi:hypothetical protein
MVLLATPVGILSVLTHRLLISLDLKDEISRCSSTDRQCLSLSSALAFRFRSSAGWKAGEQLTLGLCTILEIDGGITFLKK